jgi:SHS2 domain-containing protein
MTSAPGPDRPVARGHRVVEHTADQILEAWGPTRASCLEEAVAGFATLVADLGGAAGDRTHTLRLAAAVDSTLLLDLLEELVYLLDTETVVPVRARVADHADGVEVTLDLVDLATVSPSGPAPKGVSHSGLALEVDASGWSARALIDI